MASRNINKTSADELDRLMSPRFSRGLISLLRKRGWDDRAIAESIAADVDFVRRVSRGAQSFSGRDLKRLARSEGTTPHELLYDAIEPAMLRSQLRGLAVSTRELLQAGDDFRKAIGVASKPRRAVRAA